MSKDAKGTDASRSNSTICREKPHRGVSGLPFMNNMPGAPEINCLSRNSNLVCATASASEGVVGTLSRFANSCRVSFTRAADGASCVAIVVLFSLRSNVGKASTSKASASASHWSASAVARVTVP